MTHDKIRADAFREAAALIQKKAATGHRHGWYEPDETARLDALTHEIRMLAAPEFWPSYVRDNTRSPYFTERRKK